MTICPCKFAGAIGHRMEENKIKRTYQRYTYVNEIRDAWRLLGEKLYSLTKLDTDKRNQITS